MTPEEWQKKFNELSALLKLSIDKLEVVKDADARTAYQEIAKSAGLELLKLAGSAKPDEAEVLQSRSGQGV